MILGGGVVEEKRFFLDTSVILNWILKRSKEAEKVMTGPDCQRFTNRFVFKEVYWVLKNNKKYPESLIAHYIERISEVCTILPAPSKEEFKKIRIRDKSDRPIICSAKRYDLVLL